MDHPDSSKDKKHPDGSKDKKHPDDSSKRQTSLPFYPDSGSGSCESTDTVDSASNPSDISTSASTGSFRAWVGDSMARSSTFINENKIAARYGVLATVGVLGAYAISQTPLFFRYRNVAEIPSSFFRNRRRTLTGRLMICNHHSESSPHVPSVVSLANRESIIVYMRHLSPIEHLLSKYWLDRILKFYPSAHFSKHKREETPPELIKIQVAGVMYPDVPNDSTSMDQSHTSSIFRLIAPKNYPDLAHNQEISAGKEWISKLSEQRTFVTCQLMGRIVPKRRDKTSPDSTTTGKPWKKRRIPGIANEDAPLRKGEEDDGGNQIAVAKLFYRPKPMQWMRTDLAESMVLQGLAVASDDGLYQHSSETAIVLDTIDNPKLLRRDAAYMGRLGTAEYRAAHEVRGAWSDPRYRSLRDDVVDEAKFQQAASVLQKAWRWITQG